MGSRSCNVRVLPQAQCGELVRVEWPPEDPLLNRQTVFKALQRPTVGQNPVLLARRSRVSEEEGFCQGAEPWLPDCKSALTRPFGALWDTEPTHEDCSTDWGALGGETGAQVPTQ